MIIPIKQILLEARAIDRRIDALKKGIVPINGTNWNADRNNPKKVSKALDLGNKIKRIDNTITKYGNISPHKEYSGTIENGKINPRIIGSRNDVYGVSGQTTFHKHPNNLNNDDFRNHFKNRPISTPSGEPNGKHIGLHGLFNSGDYGASGSQALKNPNKKHTEYIFSPNTKSNTVAQLNSYVKDPESNSIQKTSFFSNKAKKYYDLNGNLKNGANDFTNPTNFLSINNIPDTKLLKDIKNLRKFKDAERLSLHEKNNIELRVANNFVGSITKDSLPSTRARANNELKKVKDRDNLVRNKLRKDPIDLKELNYFHNWAGDKFANSPTFVNRPYSHKNIDDLRKNEFVMYKG